MVSPSPAGHRPVTLAAAHARPKLRRAHRPQRRRSRVARCPTLSLHPSAAARMCTHPPIARAAARCGLDRRVHRAMRAHLEAIVIVRTRHGRCSRLDEAVCFRLEHVSPDQRPLRARRRRTPHDLTEHHGGAASNPIGRHDRTPNRCTLARAADSQVHRPARQVCMALPCRVRRLLRCG